MKGQTMEKRIAIITGASGGIGKEFTKLMLQEEVEEIWSIARNQEKLKALQKEFGDKVVPISKDLTKSSELHAIGEMLKAEKPTVAYLVNNAGIAKMGSYKDFSVEEIEATISTNCNALAVLCTLCIPYMRKGSRILNISSASSFQPLPYLNLYSATKSFIRGYSRALNAELKGTGITATAVCPSWVDTDLLIKEVNGEPIRFDGIVPPEKVVIQAMRDAKRGRDMSVCTLYVKFGHTLAKLFPQKMTMNIWIHRIKKYITSLGWGL
jgi:short-subunit dehydrogenase